MKVFFFLFFLLLGCSHSNERILSRSEMESFGLTAMIFDAPICHTSIDKETGNSKVDGPCELVSCEKENDRLVCRAIKEKILEGK